MHTKDEADKKTVAFQNDTNTLAYNFLKHHSIGTLATVDASGKPYGSIIYYVIDEHFIVRFTTKTGTMKHRNLQDNPHAMLVIYDPTTQTVAQVAGQAISIDSSFETREMFKNMLEASIATSDSGVPPLFRLIAGVITPAMKCGQIELRSCHTARYTPLTTMALELLISHPKTRA